MEKNDEKMFFAAMALVGLVMRGESPIETAERAWAYADAMLDHKPKEDNEQH
jgi:hypothetical protein